MTKHHEKFVIEGGFVAQVEVDLILNDTSWSPCLSLDDATKLDEVRKALRKGDIASAAKKARIFRLTPVTLAA